MQRSTQAPYKFGATVANGYPDPTQIWWETGRWPQSQKSAQILHKFGGKLADGRCCGKLPRFYTNLVVNWQMAAAAEICSGSVQIWWHSIRNKWPRFWKSAQILYKFGDKLADGRCCRDLLRLCTDLVAQWQMTRSWKSAQLIAIFGSKPLPRSHTNLVKKW